MFKKSKTIIKRDKNGRIREYIDDDRHSHIKYDDVGREKEIDTIYFHKKFDIDVLCKLQKYCPNIHIFGYNENIKYEYECDGVSTHIKRTIDSGRYEENIHITKTPDVYKHIRVIIEPSRDCYSHFSKYVKDVMYEYKNGNIVFSNDHEEYSDNKHRKQFVKIKTIKVDELIKRETLSTNEMCITKVYHKNCISQIETNVFGENKTVKINYKRLFPFHKIKSDSITTHTNGREIKETYNLFGKIIKYEDSDGYELL